MWWSIVSVSLADRLMQKKKTTSHFEHNSMSTGIICTITSIKKINSRLIDCCMLYSLALWWSIYMYSILWFSSTCILYLYWHLQVISFMSFLRLPCCRILCLWPFLSVISATGVADLDACTYLYTLWLHLLFAPVKVDGGRNMLVFYLSCIIKAL